MRGAATLQSFMCAFSLRRIQRDVYKRQVDNHLLDRLRRPAQHGVGEPVVRSIAGGQVGAVGVARTLGHYDVDVYKRQFSMVAPFASGSVSEG